jgi:hypothetical protein
MKTLRPLLATVELALIVPAALFMTALFLRSIQPTQFQPAHFAQQIVDWYAARTHLGLWLFLMAMPLLVVVMGGLSLLRAWRSDSALRSASLQCVQAIRSHFAILVIGLATTAAAAILCIVTLHLITG